MLLKHIFFSKNFFVSWISLETCPGVLHLQTVTAELDSVWKVKLQQLEKQNENTKETARFSPVWWSEVWPMFDFHMSNWASV